MIGEDVWTREWKGIERGCNFPEVVPLVGQTTLQEIRPYKDWLKDNKGRFTCDSDIQIDPIEPVL